MASWCWPSVTSKQRLSRETNRRASLIHESAPDSTRVELESDKRAPGIRAAELVQDILIGGNNGRLAFHISSATSESE
jgi:hypothetical protein